MKTSSEERVAHTPTPWKIRPNDLVTRPALILGENDAILAVIEWDTLVMDDSDEPAANAAFIVTACNAHEALVDALRAAESYISHDEGEEPNGLHLISVLEIIRAALSQAGAK